MRINRSAAPGPVFPTLVYADVGKAIAWLCETFGFSERLHYGPPGNPSGAQLVVGEGSVFLTQARGKQSPGWDDNIALCPPRPDERTHTIGVRVEDVDRHFEHARQRGAHVVSAPETFDYGERQYTVDDLEGHRWTFTQSVADVAPEEWGGVSGAGMARP